MTQSLHTTATGAAAGDGSGAAATGLSTVTGPTITTPAPRASARVAAPAQPLFPGEPIEATLPFRSRSWVRLAMLATDWLALETALLLAFALRWALAGVAPVGLSWASHYQPMAAAVLVLPMGFWLMGLYPGYGMGMVERLRRRVYTIGLIFAVLVTWDLMVHYTDWSRGVMVLTCLLALVLCPLGESALRAVLIRAGVWGVPTAIFGANGTGAAVVRNLREHPELGLVPVAVLDDEPSRWGGEIAGVPIVGRLARAKRIAQWARIAVIAMPDVRADRITRMAERLPFHRVILIPDLKGVASLWVWSRDFGGLLGLELQKNLLRRRSWMIKRLIDYTLGSAMLLASLPVLAVMVAWIKLVDRGPALFWQERVGLGGRSIRVWKLRTMYTDAHDRLERHLDHDPDAREQWERYFKLRDDPRILPGVGHFLRKTSLDEVPQLWNVLRGDMSLVGPRPLPHYHLEQFPPAFRSLRRQVLPGLTGLWQVSARHNGDADTTETHDTYYIRNWSLWLDAYLLSRTVLAVLRGKGAC